MAPCGSAPMAPGWRATTKPCGASPTTATTPPIRAVCPTIRSVDSTGALWVGSRGGLSRWDGEDQGFSNFLPNPADSRPLSKWVLRMGEDSRGSLWVGTRYGLNRFDRQTQTFSVFLPDPKKPGAISSEQVWAIY